MARPSSRVARPSKPSALLSQMLRLTSATVDERMLSYHLVLACLRQQRGQFEHLVTLARVVVSAPHLFDLGFGATSMEALGTAHDALERSLRESVERQTYGIDETAFELFADLLTLYEAQLREAPAQAVARSLAPGGLSRADAAREVHRKGSTVAA